jgi:site-specific recombinase XerD
VSAREADVEENAAHIHALLRMACEAETSSQLGLETWRARSFSWRLYCQWADQEGVAVLEANTEVGKRYLKFLGGRYAAPASVMNRLAQTRALYVRWRALSLTNSDPFAGLHPQRNDPANRRMVFSASDLKQLLKVQDAEAQALLHLGLYLGLKAEVIVDLDWENLDVNAGLLMTGTSTELLELSVETRRVLSAFAEQRRAQGRPPAGKVFPELTSKHQLNQYLQRLCRQQGVQPRSWTVLRTTAGIRNSSRQTLKSVQRQMEFASVRSVQYLIQRQRLDRGESLDSPRGPRSRRSMK